jgi:hypothetical protein
MSERLQGTASGLRDRMQKRYDDGFHHKHDKSHTPYRLHCRSHPVQKPDNGMSEEHEPYSSTGQVREINLRKFSRGLAKARIH